MDNKLDFRIQTLLSQKDGKVSAPMSPMLFAKEMAQQTNCKFNRLARVWFGDECINQIKEDGGLTGHDTLIIATIYENDTCLWLSLWVDTGTGGMPVAMVFSSDREIILTQAYEKAKYVRKLTIKEVSEIFDRIFLSPELLAIKDK